MAALSGLESQQLLQAIQQLNRTAEHVQGSAQQSCCPTQDDQDADVLQQLQQQVVLLLLATSSCTTVLQFSSLALFVLLQRGFM